MAPTATSTAPTVAVSAGHPVVPKGPHTSTSSSNQRSSHPTSNSDSSLDLVLDYGSLLLPSSHPAHQTFISSLLYSMTSLGFFYLSDSPLSPLTDRIFQLSTRFFELDEDVKGGIAQGNSRCFRGWSAAGSEVTLGKKDNREQIDLGVESPALQMDSDDGVGMQLEPKYLNLWGPNQFPDETVPELRGAVLEYIEVAEEVTVRLTAAIEEALGLQQGRLQAVLGLEGKEAKFATVERLLTDWKSRAAAGEKITAEEISRSLPPSLPYGRMKLVRYGLPPDSAPHSGSIGNTSVDPTAPPTPAATTTTTPNDQGVGSHRDGGWITLLSTDSQPGLQVEDLSGTWLDVPYRPGCIIVNFGQQIERVTAGLVNAATHRVILTPPSASAGGRDNRPKQRISAPYFSTPSLNAVVQPIPLEELSEQARTAYSRARNRARATAQANANANANANEHADDKTSATSTTSTTRISSVPEGDLHGSATDDFGMSAWRGLVRSHPDTATRWGYTTAST